MKKYLLLFSSLFFSFSLVSQVSIISQTNVSCPGMCNGAITLSITGGTAPYTITNLGSASCNFPPFPSMSNTVTISGLCACAYNLQVKDVSNTLIGTATATITAPPPIVTSFSVQNVCCNGLCNGAIYSFVTGGTGPYVYTWYPTGPSSANYTAACAGSYDLCVTDSKGCSKCTVTNVSQPPVFSLSSSITAASCGTCCNGVINVSGSGGQPPYTYTVVPGSLTNASGTFSNLCSGSYSVCSSDNGCCMTCIGVTVPSGSATAIQNVSGQSINISIVPNPSDGNFKIISQQNIYQFNYEIFDIIGNKIVSEKVSDNINISQSADGIYILIVRNAEGEMVTRRKINVKH